jgi:hypothetical protein
VAGNPNLYEFGGHYYEVVNTNVTWTEALRASAAKSLNGVTGHLVTITSAQEQEFLTNLVNQTVNKGWDNKSIWIAASDAGQEGVWKWVDGPEAGKTFWTGNQNGSASGGAFNAWITSYLRNEASSSGMSGSWSNSTGSGSDYAFLDAFHPKESNWDDIYSSVSATSGASSPVASSDGVRNAYVIEYSPTATMGAYLDGSGLNTVVQTGVTNLPSGNSARSYSAWIQLDADSTQGVTIIGHGALSGYRKSSFMIGPDPGNAGKFWAVVDFQVGWAGAANLDLADGKWHQITLTYDPASSGTGMNVYLDGVSQTVTAGGNGFNKGSVNTLNDGTVTYGFNSYEAGHEFRGRIDDAALWDRALSPAEVALLSAPNSSLPHGYIAAAYINDGLHASNRTLTGGVTIAGTVTQGQTLTASNDLADADGIPSTGNGAIKYQWKAGGVAIAGAIGSTYTLTQAEVGKAITVTASYTDLQGTAESVTSGATVLVGSAWRPVLALDFEGPDGSSSFGANITKLGSPVIDTAAKTQGQSSLYLAGDGSALIAGQSLNIGQSDFSIEFDFKTDGAQNPWSVMVSSKYEGSWGEIGNGASSAPGIHFANGGFLTGQNFNDGQWHRLAAMQIGSQSYLYVDGVLQDQEPNLTVATHNFTDTVIGKLGGMWIGNSDNSFRGWIDNFSINIANAGNSAASGAVYMLAKLAVPESSRPLQAGDITNSGTQKFNSANNHIYEYVDAASSFTWTSAKAAAESKTLAGVSGHLVTITSASEQSFVLNNNTGGWGRWMGASDAQTEGQWKWVSGPEQGASLSGYTNWDSDEPNGTTGINSVDEDYGHFWPTTGLWNDAPNTGVVPGTNGRGELRGYVVEYSGKIITAAAASAQLATAQAHFTEDQTLFADASALSDADGLGPISYRWQRGTDSNGNGSIESSEWTDISGAGTTSYTLGDADVGRAVRFAASYTDLRGTTETVYASGSPLIANINDAPAGAVTLSGTATQGQTLTASNNLTDVDGIPTTGDGAIKYQWKAGGANITGATSSTYTLTQAEVGKAITVTASYTDSLGTAESVTSAASAAVANVNDAPNGAARMLSMDSVASTRALLASDITNASTQKFNTANSHVYEYVDANVTWTAAKAAAEAKTLAGLTGYLVTITSASEQSFVLANNVTSVGRWMGASDAATEGAWRWVTGPEAGVQFWSGSSGGSALNGAYKNWPSSEPNNSADEDYGHFWPSSGLWNDAPDTGIVIGTNSSGWIGGYVVEYSGTVSTASISQVPSSTESHFTEDKTLHADGSLLSDPDGLGPLSYQWQRATDTNANGSIEASEWANIQSATATSYTLGDTDSGKYVRLAISYSDALGTQETVYSASSLIIKNINDAPTGSVAVAGTATQGQTLTASNNLTDADGIPTTGDGAIKYQWKAGGANIAGATSSTYTLTQAEVGKAITVTASYTDLQGTAESMTSTASAVVAVNPNLYEFDGHYYEVVNTNVTWTEALRASAAKSLNGVTGHLVTITSAQEQGFLTNLVNQTVNKGWDNKSIWIAASDAGQEGVWKWVDGPEAGKTFWTGNQNGSASGGAFNAWITSYLRNEASSSGMSGSWSNSTGSGSDYAFLDAFHPKESNWDDIYSSVSATSGASSPVASSDGVRNAYVIEYSPTATMGAYLDGSGLNTVVQTGVTNLPSGNSARSYSAWIQLDADSTQGVTIIGHGALSGYRKSSFMIGPDPGNAGKFWAVVDFQVGWAGAANLDLADGKWHQITLTYDPASSGTGMNVYLDGVSQTVTAGGNGFNKGSVNTLNDGTVTYGFNSYEAGHEFRGRIDDAALWDRALSPAEVALLSAPNSSLPHGYIAAAYINDGLHASNRTLTGGVTIAGTVTQGQTLTASNDLADADGIPSTGNGAIKYQWKAGGVAIAGAIGSTYTLTQAEVGKAITVTASYTDLQGTAESVTSGATVLVGSAWRPVLALDFEGPDGSSSFGANITKLGSPVIDTAAKTQGQSSLYLAGDGSALIAGQSLNIGQSDFSIEFDFKTDGAQNPWSVMVSSKYEGSWGEIGNGASSAPGIHFANGGFLTGQNFNDGQWHRLAAMQIGSQSYLYVDGVLQDQEPNLTVATHNFTDTVIGKLGGMWIGNSDNSFRGWIDNFSINIANAGNSAASGAVYMLAKLAVPESSRPLQAGDITNSGTQKFNSANNHIYEYVDAASSFTWTSAKAAAESKTLAGVSGHLVTITSASEQSFVLNNNTGGWGRWMGASDAQTEGQWKWVSGPEQGASLSGYTNWDSDEPNGTTGINSVDEDYGHFWPTTGLWNDAPNTGVVPGTNGRGELRGYVVEYSGKIITAAAASAQLATAQAHFTEDQTLFADASALSDADGLGPISYRWQRGTDSNGNGSIESSEWTDISGAGTTSYTLGDADVGRAVRFAASYTDLRGTTETVYASGSPLIANINDAPAGAVTLSGTATQGQTLTASNNLTDVDGIPTTGDGAIKYQWKAGGANITGATSSTYTLTQAEVGKAITVTASYTDSLGTAESVTSAASAAVANVNDAPNGAARMLSMDSVASTRALLASDITNASTQKFNTANSHVYEYVDANVTWTAAKAAAEAKTLAGLTGYLVTITSASEQSFVLANNVTSVGRWMGASDAATEGAWRWVTGPEAGVQFWSGSSGGSALNGAYKNWPSSEPNNSADEDYGHFWPSSGLWNDAPDTGIVIGTNSSGWIGGYVVEYSGTVSTASISQVPSSTESHFTEDKTLHADGSLLSDPDGLGPLSYQWQRATDTNANGSIEASEWANIQSATATSYTLGDTDSGKYVRLAISYSDALGTQETVYSASSLIIKNINDAPTGSVAVAGTATQGQTLTASNNLTDADGIPTTGDGAIKYQWKAGGANIAGATSSTYTLTQAEVGKAITVTASYTDLQGTAESMTSTASAVVAVNPNLYEFDGHYYEVVNTNVTWTEALRASAAKSLNGVTGHLVTITSAQEQGFLTNLVNQTVNKGWDNKSIWIAASDAGQEGVWKWVDGPEAGKTFWTGNQNGSASGGAFNAWITSYLRNEASSSGMSGSWSNSTGSGSDYAFLDAFHPKESNWDDIYSSVSATSGASSPVASSDGVRNAYVIEYSPTATMGAYLDGSGLNTVVQTGVTNLPSGNSARSYSAWIQLDADSTQGVTIIGHGALSGYRKSSFMIGPDQGNAGNFLAVLDFQVGWAGAANLDLADGKWHQITLTYDPASSGTGMNVYLDGVSQTVTAGGNGFNKGSVNTLNDGTVTYGFNSYEAGHEFRGRIDDAALWDRALSPAEVALLSAPNSSLPHGYIAAAYINDGLHASNRTLTGGVTIAGTVTQGQTLTASNDLADADGIPSTGNGAIKYQWKAGGVAIAGAIGSTYTLTQAEVGKAITVTASYTDLQGTAESVTSTASAAVVNVNDTPTGSVAVAGTATQGQTLTASNTLLDADGIPTTGDGAIKYQWKAGDVAIAAATSSTYTLTQAEVGKAITVTASYTDSLGTPESVTSAASAAVVNVNDTPTGSVALTGTATQGQTLTASNTLLDADGIPTTGDGAIKYQWKADGDNITGATSSTYTLTQAEVGKAITVTASYTDSLGTAESVTSAASAAVANVNDAPNGAARMLSMDSVASTRALLASDITNASTQKFNTANSHVYEYVDANVTWTAAKAAAEAKTLAGLTGYLVTITSASEQSFVLTNNVTSVGRWMGASDAATEGAWRWVTGPEAGVQFWSGSSGGSALNGAYKNWPSSEPNNSADEDYGHFWPSSGLWNDAPDTGIVIGTNSSGWIGGYVVEYSGTVSTASISQVPSSTESHFTEDKTLHADGSLLSDPDGLGPLSYQWQRATDTNANGSIEASEWANIQSATATSYTLGDTDSGKYVRLAISYSDALGTQETVYSASSLIIKNINDAPTGSVTISGTVTQGQTLTASNNLTDADGTPTTGDGAIKYQWKAGGANIAGATSSTYTLTQAEVGKAITVTASYTDLQGTAESVTSAVTQAVVEPSKVVQYTAPGVYLESNYQNIPHGSQPRTIEVSFKLAPSQPGGSLVSIGSLGKFGGLFEILILPNGKPYFCGYDADLVSTKTISDDQWHSVAVSYNGTEIAMYVDGILDVKSTSSTPGFAPFNFLNLDTTHTPVGIGGKASNANLFPGEIRYASIWNKALNQNEVQIDDFSLNDSSANLVATVRTATKQANSLPIGTVTTSGAVTQGQTLTASDNLTDADGIPTTGDGAIKYQWKAGGVNIASATSSTYVLTQAEVGKAITVTASYTDLQGTAESVTSTATANVGNVNDPLLGGVSITGTATQGQNLTASNTLSDADGIPNAGQGAIKYQWKVGGVNIDGATSSAYTLTQAEVGKPITVTASFTDLQGTAESVTSTATANVGNVNDPLLGSVSISGTATQGQTLTASNTLSDADGIPSTGQGAIKYQWKAGGVMIDGATSSSHTLSQAEVGKAITVTANYTDLQGTVESVTSTATASVGNVNDPPLGGVSISGTATQGQTLTTSNTLSDADGIPTAGSSGAITYQWRAGGAAIASATSSTYTLTQAEVGKAITVTASYTDLQGTAESVTSTATLAVDGLPAGIEWSSANDLRTSESGTTATFGARLSRAPLHPVTVELSISDATEGVFLASGNAKLTLSFTAANWNTAQSITVKGYDDELRDGDVSYVISARTTSNDAAYDGLRNGQGLLFNGPTLINADDDAPVNWLGTEGNDTYASSSGDDDLYGYNGRDDLSGGKGHDRIYGGYGDDRLNGQEGNDAIEGEQGNDAIDGGAGNDRLLGGTGNDTLLGGDGDDVLDGDKDADTMDGGNGADLYYVDNPGDAVSDSGTDAAIDILYVASYLSAPVVLGAGIENATLDAAAGSGALVGNASNNSLKGNAADNQLNGGLGSDTLESGAGNDTVDAGDGDDLIVGGDGAGNDHYIGGSGQDTVRYTSAFNAILVNLLQSVASGQDIGSDTLSAIENFIGGKAGDTLMGDAQANVIDGHTGNDSITGGGGNDTLDGGEGQDTAIYALAASNYTVTATGTGYQVLAKSGAEGSDQLRNIESLQFADRTGTAASFLASEGQTGNQATFWKNASLTPSEANKTAAVNLNDAISVLKMIVGLPVNSNSTPLSAYQSLAADFDQDGLVGLNDAIGVLKMVVGLAAPSPTWRYYEADKLKTSLSASEALAPGNWSVNARIQDPSTSVVSLVGVLTGDVDGSWVG